MASNSQLDEPIPKDKGWDLSVIGLQPVKSLYAKVIKGVLKTVEEAFLDEGIDKEVWLELEHLWQSKLVAWNVIDPVERPASSVESPGPRNGASVPSLPAAPFLPSDPETKVDVDIQVDIPDYVFNSVTIHVPFSAIHDNRLQKALAQPQIRAILKNKDRLHTLQSKVLDAIRKLTSENPPISQPSQEEVATQEVETQVLVPMDVIENPVQPEAVASTSPKPGPSSTNEAQATQEVKVQSTPKKVQDKEEEEQQQEEEPKPERKRRGRPPGKKTVAVPNPVPVPVKTDDSKPKPTRIRSTTTTTTPRAKPGPKPKPKAKGKETEKGAGNKKDVNPVIAADKEEVKVVKRGRGRPPKPKPLPVEPTFPIPIPIPKASADKVKQEQEETEGPPKKRGRGRPRRVTLVNENAHLDGAAGGDDDNDDDADEDADVDVDANDDVTEDSDTNLSSLDISQEQDNSRSDGDELDPVKDCNESEGASETEVSDDEVDAADAAEGEKDFDASIATTGNESTIADDGGDDSCGNAREKYEESENDGSEVVEEASMYCQYDKITRTRNKWKFYLKDGILNVNGKDYLFQKAHGDAEW